MGPICLASSRFNSATTFQPWKHKKEFTRILNRQELQFGHDFSAVETCKWFCCYTTSDRMASIRPRLFSRRNRRRLGFISLLGMMRFNSATTFQPWKLGTAGTSSALPGATASIRPRLFSRGNELYLITILQLQEWLQFGHDFSAVETEEILKLENRVFIASIRPRLFSRGNRGGLAHRSGLG